MGGKTIEHIVTRNQYSWALTVSPTDLLLITETGRKVLLQCKDLVDMVSTKSPKLALSKRGQLKTSAF